MNKYYDGTKLLSLRDINGNIPEIYICTSNRNAGKTTYFNRYFLNRFLKHREKFILLYRYNYELSDCHDKFFAGIKPLFFQNYVITSKSRAKGAFSELFIAEEGTDEEIPCGYALSINNVDNVKKYSHMFHDAHRILFDEFQSESGRYADKEIEKFLSIHTSLARGGGKQVKYLPVYMLSNTVSLLNPYYVDLGISERLQKNTKFLRGDGFVLEAGFNESASRAQETSGFNRAFKNNSYVNYASNAVYLRDDKAFIEKPKGKSKYLATLKYDGNEYAVREFFENGIIYCDDSVDSTNPNKLVVTTDDHEINYVMLSNNSFFINQLRFLFEKGAFRFKNLKCKQAILHALKY